MNIRLVICLWFIVLNSWSENAETNMVNRPEPKTNAAPAEIDLRRVPWTQSILTNTIAEKLQFNLNDRLDDISRRKLHPFNTLDHMLSIDHYDAFDAYVSRIGIKMIKQSAEQGFRETAKDVPFVYSQMNQDTFFAHFFRDSVGNTAEENFKAEHISYSTNDLTTWQSISGFDETDHTNHVSRWKRIVHHAHIRYGARLHYAYTAWTLGNYLDKPLLFMDLRYHYADIVTGDILATDTELLTSLPLGDKTFCTIGIVQKINPPEWERKWSFKVTQRLDGSRIFIGITMREKQRGDSLRYICGFERTW